MPPERFQGDQLGQVIDIKKIGETVAAVRKLSDHYEASIYDGRGNLTTVSLDPSTKDLLQKNTFKQYVKTRADNIDSNDEDPADLFLKLGFSEQDAQVLRERFYVKMQDRTSTYIPNDELKQGSPIYIPAGDWELGVKTSKDEVGKVIEKFIFQSEHGRFIVDPSTLSTKSPVSKDAIENVHEEPLNNDLSLVRGNTVFTIQTQDGRQIGSYTGINPVVDPTNPDRLLFINSGKVYGINISGIANRISTPQLESQINVNNVRELQIDPNGNFYIIRTENHQLLIVDRDIGEVAQTFDNIPGPIMVDKQGDILLVDHEGKLREIQTNFQAIPPGGSESAREKREEQLKELQERFSTLELGKVQKQKSDTITEQDVANTLRESIAKQVSEPITNAQNPEAVEDILDRLQGFKADPSNQAYAEVIDEFVTQARDKLSSLRTADFDIQLGEYQKALDEVQSVGGTIGLDEQFAKLLQLRQKIDITDPVKRREIEQRIQTIQGQKDLLVGKYQGELVETINQTLPTIEQLIKETGSIQELGMFGTTLQAQQFEMMLNNIKDPEVRKQLRDKYVQGRNEQRGILEERSRALDDEQRLRYAQVVEEVREDLSVLQGQILELSETRDIDRFGRNPLVTAFRAKIFALPPELREIEEKRLEIIMGARKKDLEHRSELGAIGEGAQLRFGNAIFPIYKEPPRLWQPKLVPFKGGGFYSDLVFEDSQGRVFHPDPEHPIAVNPDLNDERTKGLIDRYRKEADEFFRNIKRKVPDFDEHWRITDFHMGKLEEIAEALNLQLVNHRGILILQGEAGTGKNVLVDMLSNLSNREVVPVLCNENSVKEDLTYEFYYDPEKGTYKLPSKLIEGIQTPGAVILFDEINALKPGIAKMLNSLFDYRRRIYLPEGGKERDIITDPTVLFIGTMNPQNYAGVNRLSPEVKSRARVVDLDYPPFEERGNGRINYRSDEAEMLAAYMDEVGDLKQKELKMAWNYVVNNDTTNGADAFLTDGMKTDIRRIYDVIRVANRLREMYEAYQIGDSNEPMDFPTSLREVTDIVMEMNHRQGVKPIVKRVIIPKIDDRAQKRMVEAAIDAVLPGS